MCTRGTTPSRAPSYRIIKLPVVTRGTTPSRAPSYLVIKPQVVTRGTTPSRAPNYSTPSPAPSILSTKKRGYQQVFHLINSLCKEKNILKL